MTVAVDTMVMIWGLPGIHRKIADVEVQELIVRSRLLLTMLSDRGEKLVVPTVSIAELLVPLSDSERGKLITEFQERFLCPVFDLRAAAIAAQLWQFHKSLPKNDQYGDRRLLRADLQIIATAKASHVTEFFSHDPKCRRVAEHLMKARDLPTRDPKNMFLADEIREELGFNSSEAAMVTDPDGRDRAR